MSERFPFYTLSPSGELTLLELPAQIKAKCSTPYSLGDGDETITYGPAIGPGGAIYVTTARCVLRLDGQSNGFTIIAQTQKIALVNRPQFDGAGNIYVAAAATGSYEPNGIDKEGVVRFDSSGTAQLLATLPPPAPQADANYITGFVKGRNDVIYGISFDGGKFGYGMLFSVRTDGTFSDLHDFCGSKYDDAPRPFGCDDSGSAVFANLLAAQDGTIWGASSKGIFQYTPMNGTARYVVVFSGQ